MADTQIERIGHKLEQLRTLDPQGSVLFGAVENGYRLGPPASPELLGEFEAQHNLVLPQGFRDFLLHLGNGGAGPYYGLYPLQVTNLSRFLRRPQTQTLTVVPFDSAPQYTLLQRVREGDKVSEELSPRAQAKAEAAYYAGMQERGLRLCTQGCGMDTLLVVDGPRRGQVWSWSSRAVILMGFWPEMLIGVDEQIHEVRESDVECTFSSPATGVHEVRVYDINPFGAPDNSNFFDTLTQDGPLFLDWYEHWLDAGLRYFEIQR